MSNIIKALRAKRRRGIKKPPTRGKNPIVKLPNNDHFTWGWVCAFVIGGIAFLIILFSSPTSDKNFLYNLFIAALIGFFIGIATAIIYYCYPIFRVFLFVLRHFKLPPQEFLSKFSLGQKLTSLGVLAAIPVYFYIIHRLPNYHGHEFFKFWLLYWLKHPPTTAICVKVAVIWVALAVLFGSLILLLMPEEETQIKKRFVTKGGSFFSKDGMPFALWLGSSTGLLSRLWHKPGIAPNFEIVLDTQEAAQNIVVLGGIGSGKTTRIMQPILVQLLDQKCGGLLFDIKGDVKKAVLKLSKDIDHDITVIGPKNSSLNIISGLSPEVASSFLKSAFLLNNGIKTDSFWIDTATELCRNTLGLLSFTKKHYSLHGLYGYLFDEEVKTTIQQELTGIMESLDTQNNRLLKTYLRYHDTIFGNFDDKIKSGVNATIAQVLAPFNQPDLIDAFCQTSKENLDMEAVLDGTVYLVDLPTDRWGLGAKVAYTFIKLRFFNVMQGRINHPELNQDRPVFFMCDEYQEIVSANSNGLSDLNFWDKSRSSKTIGIISTQSLSSFYASLGSRDLAHAILQNFRQKICFRTEDQATLDMLDRLAGRARITKKTESISKGSSSNLSSSNSSHKSSAQSITETREAVLDATLFRNLSVNQAVALLSIDGCSMDDVLELMPVFLND